MRALVMIRPQPHYRRDSIEKGLQSVGYKLVKSLDQPTPDDCLVIWNRYGTYHSMACKFEAAGARVFVFENGYLGNDWIDRRWYSLSLSHHNGAGKYKPKGPERWDSLGVEIAPRREFGSVLLLPQRGIGEDGVAMPSDWLPRTERLMKEHGIPYTVRMHPGKNETTPLESALDGVLFAVTWGSGAAIKALLHGCYIGSDFSKWIAYDAADSLTDDKPIIEPLEMFRRLIWAMWTVEEIESGACFDHLI